jgi:hypothetical protein
MILDFVDLVLFLSTCQHTIHHTNMIIIINSQIHLLKISTFVFIIVKDSI